MEPKVRVKLTALQKQEVEELVQSVLAARDEESAEEILRVLRGETIAETGLLWAEVYMDIFEKLSKNGRAGSTLGHDTTKEVAALILVQLMEKHA